ncbi:hypothetical protein A3F34_02040 [Candidatus Roizmanbacteria bacterium RIFCSPHIGHO2_12_FULL_44_10]|uniref:Uncharacterized protein n=1 Tax=Candidatus Roizmanbacteria bacterium RIFCSPHIGHO2_12_FULL_44_10 TaxID=1802054 RepID=A0A1F7I6C2_9BACT|nr:MAG: hypothetical protein A3F34_02040 [Candidatus Roizmanbacteria bacterium RIFCSPHIGHO2_12_FULL_44_10]
MSTLRKEYLIIFSAMLLSSFLFIPRFIDRVADTALGLLLTSPSWSLILPIASYLFFDKVGLLYLAIIVGSSFIAKKKAKIPYIHSFLILLFSVLISFVFALAIH